MTEKPTPREAAEAAPEAPWDFIDHVLASVPHAKAERGPGGLAFKRVSGVLATLAGSDEDGWTITVRRGPKDWTPIAEVQTTDDVEAAVRAVEAAVLRGLAKPVSFLPYSYKGPATRGTP